MISKKCADGNDHIFVWIDRPDGPRLIGEKLSERIARAVIAQNDGTWHPRGPGFYHRVQCTKCGVVAKLFEHDRR